MHDNKVSEKAIWEGAITPDDDTPYLGSQVQAQPQMMFCYKCNQVIPANSTYCPYCQVKLFTECPKCGAKYSSQYPACNHCGTNKQEYIALQRREEERKAAIEREKRRQREIAEHKRLEEERKRKEAEAERERQEQLRRYEQKKNERKQEEAYIKENEEIKKTKEYEETYSLLSKAIENYEKRAINMSYIFLPLYIILFIITIMFTLFYINFVIGLILMIVLPYFSDKIIEEVKLKKYRKYLQKYISSNNNHNNHMVTPDLIAMVSNQGKHRLSDCCIIAYREKHKLPINYKWHGLH